MFLLNSRLGLFSVTSVPFDCTSTRTKVPLLPKLRGQFAEFLNEGSLERLRILSSSTCVGLRYGHLINSLRGFSWRVRQPVYTTKSGSSSPLGVNDAPDFPKASSYGLEPTIPAVGWPTLLRHPFAQTPDSRYRNINLFSIAYAFRPRLRVRLTLR